MASSSFFISTLVTLLSSSTKGSFGLTFILVMLSFVSFNFLGVFFFVFNFFKWLQISGSDVIRGLNPDELVDFQSRINQEGRDRRLILNQ